MKIFKFFSFILFISTMFSMVGCKDDSDLNRSVEGKKRSQGQPIYVTEEGYLHFNS
jgi:hypothetical protein